MDYRSLLYADCGRTIGADVPLAHGFIYCAFFARRRYRHHRALIVRPLGRALKQSVIVDTPLVPAVTSACKLPRDAKPDGHALLMQYSGIHVTYPWLFKNPAGESDEGFCIGAHRHPSPSCIRSHPTAAAALKQQLFRRGTWCGTNEPPAAAPRAAEGAPDV